MKNILNNSKAGLRLYNSQYQLIGHTGEFRVLNEDGSVKWIQLLNNPKYKWIYGELTKSYKRGFIIDNLITRCN